MRTPANGSDPQSQGFDMRRAIRRLVAIGCALLGASAPGHGRAQAERVRPVPLGGILGGQYGDGSYGVYVPTRHGGTLTVRAGAGAVEDLAGPDGRPRINGREVGG